LKAIFKLKFTIHRDGIQNGGSCVDDSTAHASAADLLRLRQAMPNAELVHVHLDPAHTFPPQFAKVAPKNDGEWWNI
jgi:hypothetical protein